ncbi:hypothetical protein CSUI_005911 [Cystoisospora suis]|uniref:Uncharacterized protein n=1 Tax=Cystoisospora suis TaxID=483139 RepID=A0A2C6KVX9_9APIC|nr:hypothetical protein CSUI_005911 [Cystoisospora suis]
MFFLSAILRGGGPGRALCTPTFHGLSDGPYRRIRFSLKPIRHDYHNVLIFGDVRKLGETADELLQQEKKGNTNKSRAFWEIFSKRVKASAHLLPPRIAAKIAKSFDVHNQDTGLFVVLALALSGSMLKKADGFSLLTLTEILSRRLKKFTQDPLFKSIANHLPNVTYQLTAQQLLTFLESFHAAGHMADVYTCKRIARKVHACTGELDHEEIARASVAFAAHGYRDPSIYEALGDRAIEIKDTFSTRSLYRLFSGFHQSAVVCDQLLESFSKPLIAAKETQAFTSKEFRVISQVIADADAPLRELRRAYGVTEAESDSFGDADEIRQH